MLMDPWAAASISFAERAAQTIQAPEPLPPAALPALSLHVPGVTHVVAEDGSLQPTIFAMVASFRDYMCPDTLEDALLRATYPERIRFAVVQQNGEGDVPCDRPRTVPCETDPAQMLYLSDIQGSIDSHGRSTRTTTPVMCNSALRGQQGQYIMRHGSQPEIAPPLKGTPTLSPYWAAGFMFGPGRFYADVPYDPYLAMVFMGEEISMGVRGFTWGYDFYTPERSVCMHYYAVGENEVKRKKVGGGSDPKDPSGHPPTPF
ncbi:hypothetical protein TeGR_g3661 [Tetraparma gracilis]|uniref:Uncharacterized protein n=1 Tax=Tetraparma gracilis TaxID=2962635 RepID=A0ABQ6M6Q5_9STRA|nr:hypothetical protein TeGR_g3661 [Tetraparma gracilis]